MNQPPLKPYADQSPEERLASLDKMQNVLLHPDWRELYLRLTDECADVQRQMDEAPDWETFVAARAVNLYIKNRLLGLRDLVAAEKADLESNKSDTPLGPTEYEAE
jgi:hypothetical protein